MTLRNDNIKVVLCLGCGMGMTLGVMLSKQLVMMLGCSLPLAVNFLYSAGQ